MSDPCGADYPLRLRRETMERMGTARDQCSEVYSTIGKLDLDWLEPHA